MFSIVFRISQKELTFSDFFRLFTSVKKCDPDRHFWLFRPRSPLILRIYPPHFSRQRDDKTTYLGITTDFVGMSGKLDIHLCFADEIEWAGRCWRAIAVVSKDIDIMARTIWGEARGESREGRIAVAYTMRNRAAKSPSYNWPNTVSGVCLQPKQYSCWNKTDGNRAKMLALTTSDAMFRECLQIAEGVVSGTISDPTRGCDHYYATYIGVPAWARGKSVDYRVGQHLFFNFFPRAKMSGPLVRDQTPVTNEGVGCIDTGGAPARTYSGVQNPSSPADALLQALGMSASFAQSITLIGEGNYAAAPDLLKLDAGYRFAIADSGYEFGDGDDWVLDSQRISPSRRGIMVSLRAVRRDPDLPPPQVFIHDPTQALTDPAIPSTPNPIIATSGNFAKPTNGEGRLSSPFGPRWGRLHKGIDVAVPVGASIYAVADGVVVDVVTGCAVGNFSCGGGYGNRIYIDHTGLPFSQTRYAHLSEVLVKKGQQVKKGELIGKNGNTGHSYGPHLHFETRVGGSPRNPVDFINPIV